MFETRYEPSPNLSKIRNGDIRKMVTALRRIDDPQDTLKVLGYLLDYLAIAEEQDVKFIHRINIEYLRPKLATLMLPDKPYSVRTKGMDLMRKSLLFSAREDFDSFMQYMESKKHLEQTFWLKRRRKLLFVAKKMQELVEGKLKILGISMPPRVGKSGLLSFFLAWCAGRQPDKALLYASYGAEISYLTFDRTWQLMTDESYTFKEIFPEETKYIIKSAENKTIDLKQPNSHKSIAFRSVDGSITGVVEAKQGLVYDDLIKNSEEALNRDRLDKAWTIVTTDLKQRLIGKAWQLFVGTRWSLYDPITRAEELHKGEEGVEFIKIPALDENNKSNFIFDYVDKNELFDEEYYLARKREMDRISFYCIYQQEPMEREGLLFQKEDLRLTGTKKEFGDEYRRCAVVDVAWGGNDYLSMPCAWIVKGADGRDEFHIKRVVFNKGTREITQPLVVGNIKYMKLHDIQLEANNGGDEYGKTIEQMLRQAGWHCRVKSEKAPNNMAKISRIIQYSPDIKERCVFLREEEWDDEYREFMENLMSFNQNGKNKNDDAPDSLAMLIMYAEKNVPNYAKPLPKAFKIA